MISLSSYPSYFNKDDPQKQLAVMRQYLNTLKDEIESILSDIKYENLDPSLRIKFDSIDDSLVKVQRAITTTDENINTNYTREADLEALADDVDHIDNRVQALEEDHVTVQDLTDVSNRVSTIENANYQGQIDGLDGRLDTIEGADYQGQIDDLDGRIDTLETNSLTAANFNTKMASADIQTNSVEVTAVKIGNDTFTKQTLTIDGTTFSFLGC